MSSTILCFECYRRERNQAPTRRVSAPPPTQSPFRRYDGGPVRVPTDRQLAHQRRMLDHLARARTSQSA